MSIQGFSKIRNKANKIQKNDRYRGNLYISIKLFFNHATLILAIFELFCHCKMIHNQAHINPINTANICKIFTKKSWLSLFKNNS